MAFNAAEFRSQFSKWGKPAAANTFEVTFDSLPNVLQGKLTPQENAIFNSIRLRTQTADVPTRLFETQERRYAGPQRLMPYGLIYAATQTEFVEDPDHTIRSIFDKWQASAFNVQNSYSVAYYDDVVTTMRLRIFDSNGNLTKSYVFEEVYPISVQPSQLGWLNVDQILIVPVEFAYREWKMESPGERAFTASIPATLADRARSLLGPFGRFI